MAQQWREFKHLLHREEEAEEEAGGAWACRHKQRNVCLVGGGGACTKAWGELIFHGVSCAHAWTLCTLFAFFHRIHRMST